MIKDIIGSNDKIGILTVTTFFFLVTIISVLNLLKLITVVWLHKRIYLFFRKYTLKYSRVRDHDNYYNFPTIQGEKTCVH